jgi:Uma2 family endonuclease
MAGLSFTSVRYPESDGKPMGETDLHIDETTRLRQMLKRFYAGQSVYVSGNLLMFYEQGNPKKFVVPDVFVAKAVEPADRRFYKLWVEHKPPDVIFEITSRKTKKNDTVTKPELYRQMRVSEYFLFDPTQDYLDPPLQGHRLVGQQHEPMTADADGSLVSDVLGLRLSVEGGHLMLSRIATGQRLLTDEQAREIAESDRARAEAARANAEADRAEAEAGRAAEAAARREAEAEVARLREELRRRGPVQ